MGGERRRDARADGRAARAGPTGEHLRSAGKPAQQAAAASQLSTAYAQADAAIRKLNTPPAASGAVASLATALAKTSHDYEALSRAAAHNDGSGYSAASNAIAGDSGAITAGFDQLARLGYTS